MGKNGRILFDRPAHSRLQCQWKKKKYYLIHTAYFGGTE
jgi:hypothetical protein